MAGRPRTRSGTDVQKAPSDRPFYLFGGHGPPPVRCRTRWITDKYAYVVAPLATATLVRQRWQAATSIPERDPPPGDRGRFSVELVSAEALMGSDSGNEGLLLRVLTPKAPSPTEDGLPSAPVQGWMSQASRATTGA